MNLQQQRGQSARASKPARSQGRRTSYPALSPTSTAQSKSLTPADSWPDWTDHVAAATGSPPDPLPRWVSPDHTTFDGFAAEDEEEGGDSC